MEPQPQRQMEFEKVSIEYLYFMRDRLYYPEYQRGDVWELIKRQRLIQTILSGRSLGTLTAYKKTSEENAQVHYGIIDGRQRTQTILLFKDGAFSTATQAQMKKIEPRDMVIQPGRNWGELSDYARGIINQYNIILYSAASEDDLSGQGQSYRDLNSGKRMNLSQILKSYPSKMNVAALALSEHPFWVELYRGPKKGDERFRGALHALVMQIAEDYIPQSDSVLREYSSGLKDNHVTEALIESCHINLNIASHLFAKTRIGYPYEAIPMYQAVLFLRKAGFSLDHLEQGALTSWYSDLQSESFKMRYVGGRSLFYKMATLEEQRYFWEGKGHFEKVKSLVRQAQAVSR
jgi:hypothetical protein